MSELQSSDITLNKALKILRSYDCNKKSNTESSIELEELRSSLLLVTKLSSSQNLGICANDFSQGFTALNSYLKALDYQINLKKDNISKNSQGVYLKFSSQKMSYYSDEYTGEYRGVLISCQSEDDSIAGTYGHFPLDLFMKD